LQAVHRLLVAGAENNHAASLIRQLLQLLQALKDFFTVATALTMQTHNAERMCFASGG